MLPSREDSTWQFHENLEAHVVLEASEYPFEKYAVGQSVSRLEDPRLLRGEGCFTDDFNLDGQAYAYVFRSPFAHGVIRNLDVAAARG